MNEKLLVQKPRRHTWSLEQLANKEPLEKQKKLKITAISSSVTLYANLLTKAAQI